LGAAPALIFLFAYNANYFGSPLQTAFGKKPIGMIRAPFEGFAGLLVSPGEGLLLYSPVLLLALLACRRPVRMLFVVRVAFWAMLAHALYWASYLDWWGGSAWGPRYLAEAIPFIVFLAALGLDRALAGRAFQRKRALAWAAATLCAFSFAVQVIGMFTWDNTYHQRFDPGFWTNDGDHWAWKAPYEPWWSLRNLPVQTPHWLERPARPRAGAGFAGRFPRSAKTHDPFPLVFLIVSLFHLPPCLLNLRVHNHVALAPPRKEIAREFPLVIAGCRRLVSGGISLLWRLPGRPRGGAELTPAPRRPTACAMASTSTRLTNGSSSGITSRRLPVRGR